MFLFNAALSELLRQLDLFFPRIVFGTSAANSHLRKGTQAQQSAVGKTGFEYLKRDLVQLLGVLCHGCKAVQDRVRACGGIVVVLNLCVVDERNPCELLPDYSSESNCSFHSTCQICANMLFSPYTIYSRTIPRTRLW